MNTKDLHRQIDRLVDGELGDAELRALLRDCENDPSQWRRVALSFVESQVLSAELTKLRGAEKVSSVRRRTLLPFRSGEWLAMAAAAMIVISLSFNVGRSWDSEYELGASRDNGFGNQVVGIETPAETFDAHNDESFSLVIGDPDGRYREVEVPLLDNMQDFQQRSGVPVDLVEQIQRQGYRAHVNRTFMPVTLRDGRDAIVPIDNVRIIPKQYQ
ncbi:MAG: hypothetical protein KDB27_20735 [Planctomycetales bacterium]|nr:hypothetical protein [Planctomycetales bacterium]